jgi:hypothetical protein
MLLHCVLVFTKLMHVCNLIPAHMYSMHSNLVKSIENRRKSEKKFKLIFVGFLVKNPTTFVKHDPTFG